MFKLVKLQVETASGGTEAEVSLVAITQAEAERIQQALFERKKRRKTRGPMSRFRWKKLLKRRRKRKSR